MIQELVSALFPRFCMACQKPGKYLCDECHLQLRFASGPLAPQMLGHQATFIFGGPIQKLIHDLKYEAQFWVLDFLGEFIKKTKMDFSKIDCVIPVPLHSKRLRERGYNQSALLAKIWAKNLRCCSYPETLVRTIDTPSQTGLSQAARRANVKNVFAVTNPKTILDQSILLVDDVHTTGATLNEAARVLKEAGAKQVQTWSVAMVM